MGKTSKNWLFFDILSFFDKFWRNSGQNIKKSLIFINNCIKVVKVVIKINKNKEIKIPNSQKIPKKPKIPPKNSQFPESKAFFKSSRQLQL